MKRIVFVVALFFAVIANASANGYCNSLGSGASVQRCNASAREMLANVQRRMMIYHYETLMRYPVMDEPHRQRLAKEQTEWEEATWKKCQYERYCNDIEVTLRSNWLADLSVEINKLQKEQDKKSARK